MILGTLVWTYIVNLLKGFGASYFINNNNNNNNRRNLSIQLDEHDEVRNRKENFEQAKEFKITTFLHNNACLIFKTLNDPKSFENQQSTYDNECLKEEEEEQEQEFFDALEIFDQDNNNIGIKTHFKKLKNISLSESELLDIMSRERIATSRYAHRSSAAHSTLSVNVPSSRPTSNGLAQNGTLSVRSSSTPNTICSSSLAPSQNRLLARRSPVVTNDNNAIVENASSRRVLKPQPTSKLLTQSKATRISPTTSIKPQQQPQPRSQSQREQVTINCNKISQQGQKNRDTANDSNSNNHEYSAHVKTDSYQARIQTPTTRSVRTSPSKVASTTTTSISNLSATSKSTTQPLKRPNFVIERRNSVKPCAANLSRGKQQRASISSCSSNDSYASYGSGYASGSGNSTDHEHNKNRISDSDKNKQLTVDDGPAATKCEELVVSPSESTIDDSPPSSIQGGHDEGLKDEDGDRTKQIATSDSNNDNESSSSEAVEEDEDDKNSDFQLKRHLCELEQLTDDLANRKIFEDDQDCSITQQKVSSQKFSSHSIKSTSSSVISTDSQSNLSSLSSGASEQPNIQVESEYNPPNSPSNSSSTTRAQSESRSDSITPTVLSINLSNNSSSKGSQSHTSLSSPFKLSNLQPLDKSDCRTPQTKESPVSASSSSIRMSQSLAHKSSSSPGMNVESGKLEPYYHNLFQWEQLESKGVSRPLLINDLDFTDLRDEDDCDLLNNTTSNSCGNSSLKARSQGTGEPLHISIPGQDIKSDQDMVDSGTGSGPSSNSPTNETTTTPASAPPPLPPPPISPWFNTLGGGSRPQSQLMSSPTPSFDTSQQANQDSFNRDQSPVDSTYSNYSRNSFCAPNTSTPSRELVNQQYGSQTVSSLRSASSMSSLLFGGNGKYGNKRKKTMKLFWKEVREDRSLLSKLTKKKTIWDEIKPVPIDPQRLEYLFESKARDLSLSRSRNGLDGFQQKKAKITVLDAKRSNAINIGMTKLPPMRTIKSAILKMDSSIMNREGIEKILTTMMPTEEEKSRIIEAQLANPDTPLGTAEQFLLNLASISALEARLKLWAFQLDYAQIEKEVAEPLMDLKQAIDEIEKSETFRLILGTLLSIGNFLNSTSVKGFQIDYLEKVPEVKDTVHKHSLLHHLCLFIQERYESTSDLYSEFSAVNRASKVDYVEVGKNLKKMQHDCKASWDYLKIVAKHDGLANLMNNSNPSSSSCNMSSPMAQDQLIAGKSCGKLNNLSKLSMITTIVGSDTSPNGSKDSYGESNSPCTRNVSKQIKTKVSDFLTDCAERIMVLMVIHRRVINRFHKLLIYLGCPPHQIKQTQPQQILKIINEFALEYRTKRERVRELLMKRQNCQHNHNLTGGRWHLNRSRWTGSQQFIDSRNNRPSSTASSYASYCNGCCTQPLPQQGANRAHSPSGVSQISNYSDYLMDQTSCQSRQQSITPVPAMNKNLCNVRPNSMSTSMYDLQSQQQQQQQSLPKTCVSFDETRCNKRGANLNNRNSDENNENEEEDENDRVQRMKNEQLHRLLGVGKSFDGACSDLLRMSHWTSTNNRVVRHAPPLAQARKQRAVSIDSSPRDEQDRRVSLGNRFSNYNAAGDSPADYDIEQNSDEEILQCLVRQAAATGRNSSRVSNGSSYSTQRVRHMMQEMDE